MLKVSVIIPVYNVEKYLRECLDSVVNQTLKDIEIICVNDGSTDNSLQILEVYKKIDNRFKIIDLKKNVGVGEARNIGINKSSGEYVCFIDPDDFYPTSDIIETLYNKAIENNVKICGGEFSSFSNDSKILKQNFSDKNKGYLFERDKLIKYIDYQFDYGYHRFIYNRNFLLENNLYFPHYKRFQDPPFFTKTMVLAKEFYALHKITYAYRVNHKKIIWTEEKIKDSLLGIMDVFKFANKYHLERLREYTFYRFINHNKKYKNKIYISKIILLLQLCVIDSKVLKFYIKNLIQGIFSVRNHRDTNYKIIKILGIRFKIKRLKQ